MWFELQTVSVLERCPLFRVSFIERFHCTQQHSSYQEQTQSDNLCGAPTTVSLRVVEETEDCIDAIRHSRHTVALKQ